MRRARVTILAAVLGSIAGLATVTTASASSIAVSPTRVPVGGTVTVSGDVFGQEVNPNAPHLGCFVPGLIVLISGAFAGHDAFPGADGAFKASIGSDGRFTARVTILPSVKPGTYQVTARCNFGAIAAAATLVVTSPGFPATGMAPAQEAWPGYRAAFMLLATAALLVPLLGWLVSRRVRARLARHRR